MFSSLFLSLLGCSKNEYGLGQIDSAADTASPDLLLPVISLCDAIGGMIPQDPAIVCPIILDEEQSTYENVGGRVGSCVDSIADSQTNMTSFLANEADWSTIVSACQGRATFFARLEVTATDSTVEETTTLWATSGYDVSRYNDFLSTGQITPSELYIYVSATHLRPYDEYIAQECVWGAERNLSFTTAAAEADQPPLPQNTIALNYNSGAEGPDVLAVNNDLSFNSDDPAITLVPSLSTACSFAQNVGILARQITGQDFYNISPGATQQAQAIAYINGDEGN